MLQHLLEVKRKSDAGKKMLRSANSGQVCLLTRRVTVQKKAQENNGDRVRRSKHLLNQRLQGHIWVNEQIFLSKKADLVITSLNLKNKYIKKIVLMISSFKIQYKVMTKAKCKIGMTNYCNIITQSKNLTSLCFGICA